MTITREKALRHITVGSLVCLSSTGFLPMQPLGAAPTDKHVASNVKHRALEFAAGEAVGLDLKLGYKQKTTVLVESKTGKPLQLTLEAKDGALRGRKEPLPDALIQIHLRAPDGQVLFNEEYYIRPNPYSYKGQERADLLARWESLPAASAHELHLKLVASNGFVEVWADDRFVGRTRMETPAGVRFEGAAGAVPLLETSASFAQEQRFVPIGLQGYRRGEQEHAVLPFTRGAVQNIGGVPFQVAAPGEMLDVGKTRWLGEKVGPEQYADTQYSRSSYDRRPDNLLFAVPTDDYSQAHVLAAVDPDPNKTPVLTLAFTRLLNDGGDSGGRGDGVAYSSIRLERKNGRWPQGVRQVGTVQGKSAGGRTVAMPLLQVAVPLGSGEIPDVIDETGIVRGRSTQYMDLELSGELNPVRTINYSTFSLKPVGTPSAAQVYGLTLERAPVKVRLQPRQTGNIFSQTENIGFDLALENRTGKPFAGQLQWKLTDYYGTTSTGQRALRVPVQEQPAGVALDLKDQPLGWSRAELSLLDAHGNLVWRQPTSLAVLAPDTRRAGLESPYGAWWFRSIHGGTDAIAEIAPLFRRMGFAHTNPGGQKPNPEGAVLAQHGMSLSMLPYVRRGTQEEAQAQLDDWVAKNPGVNQAMIFHESGSGAGWQFPPEFLGKPAPKLNEKQQQAYDDAVNRGTAYARYIREKYPHLKLIVGNGPMPFTSGLMQNGYPKELVDAWGDEEVGQANIPEAPPNISQSTFFYTQQYDKKYGYGKPVTTAYEWRGRGTSLGNLTELKQAQYYTRDVLRALAYGATSINPGLIHDAGDAYYYSRWGSGGFTRRYPLLNPKISYVAMAVLTQQLDGAKFRRVLKTDSLTLHAMEFAQGGEYVTALWVPRGEKKVEIAFTGDAQAQLVDMNGRTWPVAVKGGQATITVSDSPLYLRSKNPIRILESGDTKVRDAGKAKVAQPMDDVSAWEVDLTPDEQLDTAHFDFPRHAGQFTARTVADPQRKAAIELTLLPQPALAWPVERYVTLRPKQPVALAGRPEKVGVWVKGNSGWGRVFFELTDAKGEKFSSIGAEDSGWNLGDWEGETAFNFDGWNYISVQLPRRYASGFYQPQQNNWRSTGGDGVVDFPVRVSKLIVTMREKIVLLDRVEDVKNRSVRLSGLGAE